MRMATRDQLVRPHDDASVHDFDVRVAKSVQDARGFVSAKGTLAENDYRLIPWNLVGSLAQVSERNECSVFDADLLVFGGVPIIQKEDTLSCFQHLLERTLNRHGLLIVGGIAAATIVVEEDSAGAFEEASTTPKEGLRKELRCGEAVDHTSKRCTRERRVIV